MKCAASGCDADADGDADGDADDDISLILWWKDARVVVESKLNKYLACAFISSKVLITAKVLPSNQKNYPIIQVYRTSHSGFTPDMRLHTRNEALHEKGGFAPELLAPHRLE